jgi:hypothetical protein
LQGDYAALQPYFFGLWSSYRLDEAAMKFHRLHCPAFALAVVLALLFVNGAQAFTIEDKAPPANGGNAANLANPDPNDRLTSRFNDGKQTVIKRGNATIYFGGTQPTFDQRNDPNHYFKPNTLMGR